MYLSVVVIPVLIDLVGFVILILVEPGKCLLPEVEDVFIEKKCGGTYGLENFLFEFVLRRFEE